MNGYDIGCGFTKTANRSEIVGPLVQRNRMRFCCGSFHGHAHSRDCQLYFLPLYLRGTAKEPFEQCEQAFSVLNGMAKVTRHASTYHRKQIIELVIRHMNKTRRAQTSVFCAPLSASLFMMTTLGLLILQGFRKAAQSYNKLREKFGRLWGQCLDTIRDPETDIPALLEDERRYFEQVEKEPEDDVKKIKYLKQLKALEKAEQVLSSSHADHCTHDKTMQGGSCSSGPPVPPVY